MCPWLTLGLYAGLLQMHSFTLFIWTLTQLLQSVLCNKAAVKGV